MTAALTCGEVRRLLFAFLDDELDAQTNIDLQLHLERCCRCAREAEIERTVRRHLEPALRPSAAVDAEARSLLRSLQPRLRRRGRVRRGARLAAAIAAAAVVAALWLVGRGSVGPGAGPGADARWPFSAVGLVADFERFLDHGTPLHVTSADPREVSGFMQQELARPIAMPAVHAACKLIGARRCDAFADRAALALFEVDGAPAVLVVTRAPHDLEPQPRAERLAGHTVLIRRRGDLAYAAVGDQGEPALRELLPRE